MTLNLFKALRRRVYRRAYARLDAKAKATVDLLCLDPESLIQAGEL